MLSKLSIIQKGAILVIVPLIFQTIFIVALSDAAAKSLQKLDAIEHSQRGLFALNRFNILAWNAIRPFCGLREPTSKQVAAACDGLEILFKSKDWTGGTSKTDYPELKDEIDIIESIRLTAHSIEKRLRADALDPNIARDRRNAPGAATEMILFFSDYQQFVARVVKKENEMSIRHPEELTSTLTQIEWLLALGLLTSAVISATLVVLFTANITERIKRLDRNASAILLRDPMEKPLEGTDELALLDAELHQAAEALTLSHQRQFAVLDHSNDIVLALDSNLRFLSASSAVVRTWHREESDVLARSLMTLVPPASKESLRSRFEGISKGAHNGVIECQILCGDGTTKDFLWSVRWSQQRETYSCVAHDVTEKRAIERLRENFLSMVSHDLRAPVNSISISLALLTAERRGPLEQPIQEELLKVEEAAGELIQRMDALLEVARTETTQFNLSYRPKEADQKT